MLFSILADNDRLRVLDLSNNSLGVLSANFPSCTAEMGLFFSKNTSLLHLDISYNYIDFVQTKELAISLEQNKSIYGIHFVGNAGYIDNRGFLVPEEILSEIVGSINKRRIKGIHAVTKTVR